FTDNGVGCAGATSCALGGLIAPASMTLRCSPPNGASGTQTATVDVTSDSDAGGDAQAMLTCSSGRPDIMVAPLTLTFADQLANTTSGAMAFMISNVGSSTLTYSIAKAGGTPAAFPFSA